MIAKIKITTNHKEVEDAEALGIRLREEYAYGVLWFDIDRVDTAYTLSSTEVCLAIDGDTYTVKATADLIDALNDRFGEAVGYTES